MLAMLGQHHRQWASIGPTVGQHVVFAEFVSLTFIIEYAMLFSVQRGNFHRDFKHKKQKI